MFKYAVKAGIPPNSRASRRTVQDAQSKGKGAVNGDTLPDPDSFEDEDGYAQFEQERQLEIMQEQDEQLDGVFRTVGNLRQQADDMGRELEEQGELLDEVDQVADRVGGKLQTGLQKVGWVIKQNEGIVILSSGVHFCTDHFVPRPLVQLFHCSTYICPNPTLGPLTCSLRHC